jgi:hypothetical protein
MKKGASEDLDGLNGLVYILCLGHEVYAASFEDAIMEQGLLKDKASIYQSIRELSKAGYFSVDKTLYNKRGQPRMLKANENTVIETIKKDAKLDPEYERATRTLIERLSPSTMEFPRFLAKYTTPATLNVKKLQWRNQTLPQYLIFLLNVIIGIVDLDKPQVQELGKPVAVSKMIKQQIDGIFNGDEQASEKSREVLDFFYRVANAIDRNDRETVVRTIETAKEGLIGFLSSLVMQLIGGQALYKAVKYSSSMLFGSL